MFTSFVDAFKRRVVEPAIDAKMNQVGQDWVAEATRLAPVDTGFLKSSIGFTYNASTKNLNLYCDASYGMFQEFGYRARNGRPVPAQPFMIPALSVVPRVWRGGIGKAFTGITTNLQAANLAPKYQERTIQFAKKKTRGATLKVGHGNFR